MNNNNQGSEVDIDKCLCVSVIVATKNRAKSLKRFLVSLQNLVSPPPWELIICNNGSSDETDLLLESNIKDLPVTILNEEFPGKSRAINKALAQASGELLVFSDDDVVVDPNWLVTLYNISKLYPQANVFGGKIIVDMSLLPRWLKNAPRMHGLLTSKHNKGDSIKTYGENDYPFGPNMSVRKKLLDAKKAIWPEDVGPGTDIPLGDERLFLYAVSSPKNNDRIYVPEAIVYHSLELDQISFSGALIRHFQMGKSDADIMQKMKERNMVYPSNFLFLVKKMLTSNNVAEIICIFARLLGHQYRF